MRTARAELSARAALLVLHMQPAPRQVCPLEGSDILGHGDGVSKISDVLRNYFAPEAVDAIHLQVTRFMRFRRTDQPVDEYIAEFDLFRWKAESRMEIGAGFPEQCASISRKNIAALSRHEKSLVMASCHRSLRFEDASANIRRPSGSRGSGSRQDALLTEEEADPHASEEDLDILMAYRKAEKQGAGKKKKEGPKKGVRTR